MKKKILLTGGAGYIGSQCCHNLIDEGYEVTILDNLSTGYKNLIDKRADFINLDITNFSMLKKKLKKKKFNAIFHFAAFIKVYESLHKKNFYYKNNVVGTLNLIKLTKLLGIKNFIFSSTSAVYGSSDSNNGKVFENTATIPENFYGSNKLVCEELIKAFSKIYKFNFGILRYFNVVGCDKKFRTGQIVKGALFKNLSNTLLNSSKPQINIFGKDYKTKDGTCVRDYIDVNDLSRIHIMTFKRVNKYNNSLILNCGYNGGYSVKEICKLFEQVSKKKILIKYKPRRNGDIPSIFANNKLLKKTFPNWKRTIFIKKTIQNLLHWEKKLKDSNV